MLVFHKIACLNLTEVKHSKSWAHGRVYPVVNFKVPKLVEVRASWPKDLVIKKEWVRHVRNLNCVKLVECVSIYIL